MSARLLRALQGGGVAAAQTADSWGIWRRPDRRSRMIGTLSGADVDVLRCRGRLRPLGETGPVILVWQGPVDPVGTGRSGSDIFEQIERQSSYSALEHLILNCQDPHKCEAIRQTAMAYRRDRALAVEPAGHVTMNWSRLQSDESARTEFRHDPMMRGIQSTRAQRALAKVDAVLSQDEQAFLSQLIVSEARKVELAKRFGTRAGLIDAQALALLRRVAGVYGIGFG